VTRLVDALNLEDVHFSRFENDLLIEGEVPPCSPD
jgi:hypothetical protein